MLGVLAKAFSCILVYAKMNTIPYPFTIVTLMPRTGYKELLRVLKQPYHAMI